MASAVASVNQLIRNGVHASTRVTFPRGVLQGRSRVVDIARLAEGRFGVILEETPFHPIDQKWPDQPADRGILRGRAGTFLVKDCQILAVHKNTQEVRGSTAVKKEERDEWSFVVAHVVELTGDQERELLDQELQAEVDRTYREALSLHHSASHLAALAFNRATQGYWKKAAPRNDCLNSPDTDQLAIESSTIHPDLNEDLYRFGKSLKKRGFEAEKLFEGLSQVQDAVNQTVTEWLQTKAPVEIDAGDGMIHGTRKWRCRLPQGLIEMPCGGTHVTNLGEIHHIDYRLEAVDDGDEKKIKAILKAMRS